MTQKQMPSPSDYYQKAFSRNTGLVSPDEQEKLRQSCVAVAGLGGVGGIYLTTLARMGVGKFHIADIDRFEIANMNRQMGASTRTMGMEKVEALKLILKEINPEVEIVCFHEGLHAGSIESFLNGADLVIDAIDFFALSIHELLHTHSRKNQKTVLFSAPLGFSGTLHVFTPDSMSFNDYFNFRPEMTYFQKFTSFAIGLTPWGTHWSYMSLDPRALSQGTGPSICSACDISAGLVCTEALICLLHRRKPRAVPEYTQFDPYRGIYRHGKMRWGNRNPLQRLKTFLLRKKFSSTLGLLTEKQILDKPLITQGTKSA